MHVRTVETVEQIQSSYDNGACKAAFFRLAGGREGAVKEGLMASGIWLTPAEIACLKGFLVGGRDLEWRAQRMSGNKYSESRLALFKLYDNV